jgi:TolA-binding protein
MQHKGEKVGLLLLGNPESGRRWNKEKLASQYLSASLLAATIARARAQSKDTSLLSRIRGQDPERRRLEIALEQAQEEGRGLNARITVLVKEIKARDKDISRLSQELEVQTHKAAEAGLLAERGTGAGPGSRGSARRSQPPHPRTHQHEGQAGRSDGNAE